VIMLQKKTVDGQIDARQRRRQAGFQRQLISKTDDMFMKELRKIIGHQELKGFEDLLRLAGKCQLARDDLGPLEEDAMVAEQQVEGDIWKSEQAERVMEDVFKNEIGSLEKLEPWPSISASSQYTSDDVLEDPDPSEGIPSQQTRFPIRELRAMVPTGAMGPTDAITDWPQISNDAVLRTLKVQTDGEDYHDDSIDLDQVSGIPRTSNVNILESSRLHNPLSSLSSGFERYPKLATDFQTRRERVDKWLLNTTLLSRYEADMLRGFIQMETENIPSNWSQLVIAYWEKEEAGLTSLSEEEESITVSFDKKQAALRAT